MPTKRAPTQKRVTQKRARNTSPDKEKGKEIGARIAQARLEAGGMTQRELGELVKPRLSERSIQAYEQGEVIPFRQLGEFERILGKPIIWFLEGPAALEAREKGVADLGARLAKVEKKLGQVLVALEKLSE